mgnify:CR=1 FL=1
MKIISKSYVILALKKEPQKVSARKFSKRKQSWRPSLEDNTAPTNTLSEKLCYKSILKEEHLQLKRWLRRKLLRMRVVILSLSRSRMMERKMIITRRPRIRAFIYTLKACKQKLLLMIMDWDKLIKMLCRKLILKSCCRPCLKKISKKC